VSLEDGYRPAPPRAIVLDRYELGAGGGLARFSHWLDGWRQRWLAGERVTILVARDLSHVIVVVDPNASYPPAAAIVAEQLALFPGYEHVEQPAGSWHAIAELLATLD
jgi:hypothetical protein